MVDAFCSEGHYHDHLWPIWQALPSEVRGVFTVTPTVAASRPHTAVGRSPAPSPQPILVASASDLNRVGSRPVVFAEHGAGQTYLGVTDPAYAGGVGRERVTLFLCPNQAVADTNLARYPQASVVVVGSPRVEWLSRLRGDGPLLSPSSGVTPPPTVAVSFHWQCTITPEARSAFGWYEPALPDLCERFHILGHGHPRIVTRLAKYWAGWGAETVTSFDEIVRRADLYVVDNSSTLFEAAAVGIPVVVLNAPWYRRDVEHGLRFWEYADIGPQVNHPEGLVTSVTEALVTGQDYAGRRDMVTSHVYSLIDGAAHSAAKAILHFFG